VIVRGGRILSVIGLVELELSVTHCRKCPRLVAWREQVALEKRAAFRDWDYWGKPVPGFGDPSAKVYVLGLAPAAHGGNRTGRIFTGDRSGDWLFASLYRTGFANQPTSVSSDDGLQLTGAFIAAAVRCAPPGNKPLPSERDNCLPYAAAEIGLLTDLKAIVCLGSFAWDAAMRILSVRPKPRFGHGVEYAAEEKIVIGSYHPSQQNTFTGKLTESMLDSVFTRAREIAALPPATRDLRPR
jgi:uracil-DNA glycosylase family 4